MAPTIKPVAKNSQTGGNQPSNKRRAISNSTQSLSDLDSSTSIDSSNVNITQINGADLLDKLCAKIDSSTNDIKMSISEINNSLASHKSEIEALKSTVANLSSSSRQASGAISSLEHNTEFVERELKRINLVISGLQDAVDEYPGVLKGKIAEFLTSITDCNIEIDTATRIGKFVENRCRHIKVRFLTMTDRNRVYESRFNTTPPVFINEDLPFCTRKDNFILRQKLKELKEKKIPAEIVWTKKTIKTGTHCFTLKDGVLVTLPLPNIDPHSNESNSKQKNSKRLSQESGEPSFLERTMSQL